MRHAKTLAATAAALILTTASVVSAQQGTPAPKAGEGAGTLMQSGPAGGMSTGGPSTGGMSTMGTLVEVKDGKTMATGLAVSADDLQDMDIYGTDGKKIGEVGKVLADSSDAIKAVTLDVGGFLGMGARQVILPIDKLQKGTEADRLQTSLTKAEIEGLDEWENRAAPSTAPSTLPGTTTTPGTTTAP